MQNFESEISDSAFTTHLMEQIKIACILYLFFLACRNIATLLYATLMGYTLIYWQIPQSLNTHITLYFKMVLHGNLDLQSLVYYCIALKPNCICRNIFLHK